VSGIFSPPTTARVAATLQQRCAEDWSRRDEAELRELLAEAVYLERQRFARDRSRLTQDDRDEAAAIEHAARALHRPDRSRLEGALLRLVARYAHEIHNRFSPRAYQFATRVLPSALGRLLTASLGVPGADAGPKGLAHLEHLQVEGPLEQLRALAKTHTLVVAPTHMSNLDSPIIGYALHAAGLPPCIYGAGLNLFGNPAMSFFMSRLGAYTVDRRKKHRLYKQVLTAYSTDAITRRCHSLFFPGGTRSRSGRVEHRLKKGLLGTGLVAWQRNLAAGTENPDVLVVPCTLSFSLVLEAETLIEDALAEEGRSRYIITDDEFSEPRTVASFGRQVMSLDASAIIRFGAPLDPMGNATDEAGGSLDGHGRPIDRREYVTDRAGAVAWDTQRDRVYTNRLAGAICRAYHRDNTVLSTHVAAAAAMRQLGRQNPGSDIYRLAVGSPAERTVQRSVLLSGIDALLGELDALVTGGRIRSQLRGHSQGADGERARGLLTHAIDRFGRFHSRATLAPQGEGALVVDARLAHYYANRLMGYGLPELG